MDPVALDVERRLWHSAFSLVCAIVGSSAGLYCLFRLPLMLQLFHPGSFLLALVFCMTLFAWPLVIVELAIGQKFRLSAVPALDQLTKGGKGIAFASVLVGSLLTAAYSSSSLALVVSPGFDQLINQFTSSSPSLPSRGSSQQQQEQQSSTNSSTIISNNTNISSVANTSSSSSNKDGWLALLALLSFWLIAAYLSWKFINQASLFSRILTPLPLLLWCILAIFASTVVENSDLFRDLLSPNSASLSDGRLWANAAGQALLLLQVGTGVTITFGSKSKSVHSVVNVSVAIIGVALLFAFFVTVTSAGSIAIINNANATSDGNLLSGYSSLLTTTTSAPSNDDPSLPTSTTTVAPSSTAAAAAGGRNGNTIISNNRPQSSASYYFSSVTILPALFVQAGQGSTAFGVIVYIVAVVVGILSMTLLLSSFYNSMADLHVALRSPLTTFIAAAVCFAIGAPFAFLAASSSSSSNDTSRSSSSGDEVLLALDQAVVGTCLPLLVLAESIAVAFGGWSGPSAWVLLKEMNQEDLSWSGKLMAGYTILRDFGGSTRYHNLLQVQESEKEQQIKNADAMTAKVKMMKTRRAQQQQSPNGFANDDFIIDADDLYNSQKSTNFIVTAFGKLVIFILPFFLKLFVPICAILVTFTTLINFAADESKSVASEVVFAIVVIGTLLSVYVVAVRGRVAAAANNNRSSSSTTKKKPTTPWVLESHYHHQNDNSNNDDQQQQHHVSSSRAYRYDEDDEEEFTNIAPPPQVIHHIPSSEAAAPANSSSNDNNDENNNNSHARSTSSLNPEQMEQFERMNNNNNNKSNTQIAAVVMTSPRISSSFSPLSSPSSPPAVATTAVAAATAGSTTMTSPGNSSSTNNNNDNNNNNNNNNSNRPNFAINNNNNLAMSSSNTNNSNLSSINAINNNNNNSGGFSPREEEKENNDNDDENLWKDESG